MNSKVDAGLYPIVTILYWDHEQESTLLQFAFSFGRKVRAAPSNTERKRSARVKEHTLSTSGVSKQDFVFSLFVSRQNINSTSGLVKQDSLRCSVSASRLEQKTLWWHAQKRRPPWQLGVAREPRGRGGWSERAKPRGKTACTHRWPVCGE